MVIIQHFSTKSTISQKKIIILSLSGESHIDFRVIKEGTGILHHIFRFSGGANIWGRIHQGKSWYSLGPSQTSKVDVFAEIIFGCKPLTLFFKTTT